MKDSNKKLAWGVALGARVAAPSSAAIGHSLCSRKHEAAQVESQEEFQKFARIMIERESEHSRRDLRHWLLLREFLGKPIIATDEDSAKQFMTDLDDYMDGTEDEVSKLWFANVISREIDRISNRKMTEDNSEPQPQP